MYLLTRTMVIQNTEILHADRQCLTNIDRKQIYYFRLICPMMKWRTGVNSSSDYLSHQISCHPSVVTSSCPSWAVYDKFVRVVVQFPCYCHNTSLLRSPAGSASVLVSLVIDFTIPTYHCFSMHYTANLRPSLNFSQKYTLRDLLLSATISSPSPRHL